MTTEQRFWRFVNKDGPNGCWLWTGGKNSEGYGRARRDGRLQPAHRIAWELTRGEIPVGLTIDHLCRNTLCMNPDHMEPVTQRVNILRGNCVSARNAKKTHCNRGHAFTPENTATTTRNGAPRRVCRTCKRANATAHTKRRKAIDPTWYAGKGFGKTV